MRWKARKPKPEPKPGDTRIIREFLFLPLTIGGETRWLEFAWIKQQYDTIRVVNGCRFLGWEDVEWAEPQKGPPNPRPTPAPRPKTTPGRRLMDAPEECWNCGGWSFKLSESKMAFACTRCGACTPLIDSECGKRPTEMPIKPNVGGVNEKPVGKRPEPPPAPPRPLAEELIARGLNDICGALKGEH